MLYEDGYIFISNNKHIDLTLIETKILSLLLRNKGTIIRYEDISKQIFKGQIDKYYLQSIMTRICRLRKKLKGEVNIETKPKIGYVVR